MACVRAGGERRRSHGNGARGAAERAHRGRCLRRGRLEFPVACRLPFVCQQCCPLVGWTSLREKTVESGSDLHSREKRANFPRAHRPSRGQKGQDTTPEWWRSDRLTKNGFYQVSGLPQTRWLAVNTGDAAESDLRARRRRTIFPSWQRAGEPCRSGAGSPFFLSSHRPGMVSSPSPPHGIRTILPWAFGAITAR